MPKYRGEDSEGPYYLWGEPKPGNRATRYHYTAGDKKSREAAYAKMMRQARAIEASKHGGGEISPTPRGLRPRLPAAPLRGGCAGGRAAPGSTGRGKFYRIRLRDDRDFVKFRTQDVGEKGHLERLAGLRSDGYWATVSYLVEKGGARPKDTPAGKVLEITDPVIRRSLSRVRKPIRHVRGDIYESSVPRVKKHRAATRATAHERRGERRRK